MSPISTLLSAIGLVLLVHAGYSAHEHVATLLHSSSTATSSSLPIDITLETILSVLLVSVGIVLSASNLEPISWRTWAGNLEKTGDDTRNPYKSVVEERLGFVDIRAKRKEFADWVRERDTIVKS